jgi:hypothetical protein
MQIPVKGNCPMGCGSTLVCEGVVLGQIKCTNAECPNPDAVTQLLETETNHFLNLSEAGFDVRHPIREAIGTDECPLLAAMFALKAAPIGPGLYRVAAHDAGSKGVCPDSMPEWRFERLGDVILPPGANGASAAPVS